MAERLVQFMNVEEYKYSRLEFCSNVTLSRLVQLLKAEE